MKIVRISLLLLILTVAVVSGCKVAQKISDTEPGTLLEGTPTEQSVDTGLQELQEIDALEEENDLGLDEMEKMQLE